MTRSPASFDSVVMTGHFQTSGRLQARSVDPPAADMRRPDRHVGFVPTGDIAFGVKTRATRSPRRLWPRG